MAGELPKKCMRKVFSIMKVMVIMDVAPFTTDPFATGPFTTRLVVKGSVIIIIPMVMMMTLMMRGKIIS